MSIKLSKQELENIKNYKYSTSPWTKIDLIYDHFWNFCVNRLSKRIAPNLITLCGIIFPVLAFINVCSYDFSATAVLPASVFIANAFGVFWYQTLDAIDGKQARRTDNCSCLGQLLDHNLDQFSHVFFLIQGISMARTGGRFWAIVFVASGQLLPHYSIEYRKYFTGFHATVSDMAGGIQIGATECCILMMGYHLMNAILPETNTIAGDMIDLKEQFGIPFPQFKMGTAWGFATFILSIQYNGTNFYYGYTAAKDKVHAILCTIPFFLVIFLIWISPYSQFWEDYVVIFILGFGILLTCMTGALNLRSSAKSRFNPIGYLDPPIYFFLLYCDYNRLIDTQLLAVMYITLIVVRFTMYILFLRGTIIQICDYCDIPFIWVKQDIAKYRDADAKKKE